MIPSSVGIPHTEPRSPDQAGAARVFGKKAARAPTSLFSALFAKLRPAKEGAEGPPGPEKEARSASLRLGSERTVSADGRTALIRAGRDAASASAEASGKKALGASSRTEARVLPVLAAAQEKADPAFGKKTLSAEDARSAERVRGERLPARKEPAREKDERGSELLGASAAAGAALAAAKALPGKEASAAKADASVEGVDARKRDKKDRKDRLEINVVDQRSGNAFGGSALDAQRSAANEGLADASSPSGADLVITLREGAGDGAGERGELARPAARTSFADALARELRESYNGDIVRQASVVLKDGGDGLLRLSLRPESLGAVKIKLELTDNKVAGRILVESDEALKAFAKELRSLEQAFLDGGFDGASLELALSSGDSGAGSDGREGADAPRPFFSERLIATEYETAVPAAVAADSVIDMLA